MQRAEDPQWRELCKPLSQALHPTALLVYADQEPWTAQEAYVTDQFFQLLAIREISRK